MKAPWLLALVAAAAVPVSSAVLASLGGTSPARAQAKNAGAGTWTKAALEGRWLARDGGYVYNFDVRPGTYTWQIAKATGEVVYSEDAKWDLENGRLKQVWKNSQTGLTETAFYDPERVDDDTMRMRGGNFGLKTYLFYRVVPGRLSPAASWLVGEWTTIFGLSEWTFRLSEDGRYEASQENPISGQSSSEAGTWTFQNGTLTLQGDAASVQYRVKGINDLSVYFSGGPFGGSDQLVQRRNADPRDPYKGLSFAGQYIQKGRTLTVKASGDGYAASLLDGGKTTLLSGRAEGDTLTLKTADGQGSLELRLDNNALQDTNLYNFTKTYQKLAETTLPVSTRPVGYWINTEGFSSDSDLLLLNDGRYRERRMFDFAGKRSSSVTEGTFTLKGGKLTLDPVCASPSTYSIEQVQNHLLASFTSSLSNQPVTTTFMATPASSLEYQLAKLKEADAFEAQANAAWRQKIALAPLDTRIGRIPPSGEISLDPAPRDVFAKATVFKKQELYPYESESFYYYDLDGNFRSTTPGMLIINPGLAQTINRSRGEYRDKLNTYFFPNGRTITYVESYLNAKSIAYPPVPSTKFYWNKYRVEGDKVIVGSQKPAT